MIKINRPQLDSTCRLAKDGAVETTRCVNAWNADPSKTPGLTDAVFQSAKPSLMEMHHGKCAYCETTVSKYDDVEHFRPKKKVTEDPSHKGYWWLAYSWDNLLLSCATCNRTGNKGNHFPVSGARAVEPGDDLGAEAPLLINPVEEEPAEHLTFSGATAVPKTARGQATIDTMDLNRSDLSEARTRKYERFRALYRLLEDSASRGGVGTASWDESWDQLRKALLSDPKEPYKAMMRKAFRDAFDATV